LTIAARKESVPGKNCGGGTECQYTSARINTVDTFRQQYGRFAARIRLPRGQGLWPAFWLLGTGGWPKEGEIDILENLGSEPNTIHFSLHGEGYSGGKSLTDTWTQNVPYKYPNLTLADEFHVYSVDWTKEYISFAVDDVEKKRWTPADVPVGTTWAFDSQPFYILLNVAVGGSWPGSPNASTTFPQYMFVDWVRVHELVDCSCV
jgi:beta-glucanase (GH16 family)